MNKYKIISLIFLLISGTLSGKTFIDNKNEFINAVKSGDVIEKANEIYNTNVAFSDEFLDIWSATQSSFDAQILDDAEYGQIIKDGTGNLYFPASDVDVTSYAEKIVSFSNWLKENRIKFTYIQAPNKIVPGYSDNIVYNYNYSNKNADEFLKIISDNGVNTYDLRKELFTSGIPVDKLFYKSDHHWTTPTAFWAFQKMVYYLNKNYDLKIDEKYADINNYTPTEIQDCFIGSLGRRVGDKVSLVDDYTFIEPKFKTNYKLINGISNVQIASGSFHNAIVKDYILSSEDKTANKHATYFEWDYGHLIIKNEMIDNNIKVLLIKDSYSLPTGAFLSTCIKEFHMVDLRDTPKANLKKIIENNKFDAVIMMYNTEVFNDTMFNLM